MAAHRKHPPPDEQLRRLALVAKREGLSFTDFWILARRPGQAPVTVTAEDPPPGAVLWPSDSADRATWLGAVDESMEGWRRAYNGEPAEPREAALPVLMKALGLDEKGPSDNDREAAVA